MADALLPESWLYIRAHTLFWPLLSLCFACTLSRRSLGVPASLHPSLFMWTLICPARMIERHLRVRFSARHEAPHLKGLDYRDAGLSIDHCSHRWYSTFHQSPSVPSTSIIPVDALLTARVLTSLAICFLRFSRATPSNIFRVASLSCKYCEQEDPHPTYLQ